MRNSQTITKWLMGAALASAFALAVPHNAQAQVSFGIQAGGYAPQAYGYYGPDRYDNYQRHEYWEHEQRERLEAERAAEWRREQWEHARWHDHDGWRDRDGYRDHRYDDRH